METGELYKLKSQFAARKVGDELVVVPLTNNVARMDKLFTLNESAALLWETLDADSSFESLVQALLDTFDVEKPLAEKDVERFLTEVGKLV